MIKFLLSLFLLIPSSAPVFHSELPPECIRITVVGNSGDGFITHLTFCGKGSGADSPLFDRYNNATFIVDGGPLKNGAIIFPER